jgi:hypothetical protein
LVVEGELLVLLDIFHSENADADLTEHIPLLGHTIGVAGVVDKSCDVAIKGRIYDFIVHRFHQVGASRILVQLDAFLPKLWIDWEYFSDILHYEWALFDEFAGKQPPALVFCLYRVDIGILVKLEPPILAIRSARTSPWTAFCCHTPVQAWVPTVERLMRVSIFVLSGSSSLACAHQGGRLLLCEHVSLPLQVLVLLYRVELSQRVCEEAEPQRVFNELGFPL